VRLSFSTRGTVIVVFANVPPLPLNVNVAPLPPLFTIKFDPAVPVDSVVAFPEATLIVIDPMVNPEAPESVVTVRAAGASLKITDAPLALGTPAGLQLAAA